MWTFATWRVLPVFVAYAERFLASRLLLFLADNLPCPRGATNRKTPVGAITLRRIDGFSGFVLHRSLQPLPERGQLGRIGLHLRRDQIEAGVDRQRDLEGNHPPHRGDNGFAR